MDLVHRVENVDGDPHQLRTLCGEHHISSLRDTLLDETREPPEPITCERCLALMKITQFWIIGYGELIYNHTIKSFVPMSTIRSKAGSPVSAYVMDQFRFFSECDTDCVLDTLRSLDVSQAQKKCYGRK